jgi:hypothetical protein
MKLLWLCVCLCCCRQCEEVVDPVSGTPSFLTSTNQRQVVLGVRQVEVRQPARAMHPRGSASM